MEKEFVLTTDCCALGEGGSNFRVEVVHNFTINGHPVIAGLNLLTDPGLERVADERVDDVYQPLLWHLPYFIDFGYIIQYDRVVTAPFQQVSSGKALILRYRKVFCMLAVHDYATK